jgi:hypothetical protein
MPRADIVRLSNRPGRCNSFLSPRPWKQALARSNLRLQAPRRKKQPRRALADEMDPPLTSCRGKQTQPWSETAMATHRRNTGPMLASPRCGAKTRSGQACMSPAVSGKRRCRMHGGAVGSGAPRGNKNAVTRGFYTRKAKAERQKVRSLIRHSRDLIQKVR